MCLKHDRVCHPWLHKVCATAAVLCWMLCRSSMNVIYLCSSLRATQIAGLSGGYRTSPPPPLFLVFSFLPGLRSQQSTSRWRPSLTQPPLSSIRTGPLLKTPNYKEGALFSLQLRLCLKTPRGFPVEGFYFHTYLGVSALPPDYVSHQPPGLTPRLRWGGSQLRLHEKFFHVISCICECDDTHARICNVCTQVWKPRRAKASHISLACLIFRKKKKNVCTCLLVTCEALVFTIEWFVHINIRCVMLNVFPWWLFLGLFDWPSSWETTRFELNRCTLPWFESD